MSNINGTNAANQYFAFVKGWSAGARGAEKDPSVLASPAPGVKDAYVRGYEKASEARNLAFRDACERYQYIATPLRAKDEK